jgi:isopenicillin-N N-acyltransferase-like protein
VRPGLAAVLIAASLLPSPLPAQEAPAGPAVPWKPGEHGKGRLEVLPSGLAVLHVEGTPEEMGAQHGTLLRDQVRALVKDYLPKVLRGKREDALARAKVLEKQIPDRHLREMRAMAEAAGVPADDILLGSVVVELFGLNLCSGAAASGPATPDGRTVVGRNLEWSDHGMLGQYGLVVAARPAGFRPFLCAGFPAFAGVVTGMNGDGLFAAELVVMNGERGERERMLKGVPYPILLRRLLEECSTVAEAAGVAKGAPRTVSQNLLLADPSSGVVLECSAAACVERPQAEGLVVVTNFHGEATAPPPGDRRYEGLCASFAGIRAKGIDAAAMEASMRAVSKTGLAAMLNLQCGVFLPATLEVRISLGKPPAARRPFTVIDGAALLGVRSPAAKAVSK